jgi:hypothetical protein
MTLPSGFGNAPTRGVGEGSVVGEDPIVATGRLDAADPVGEPIGARVPAAGTGPQPATMTSRTVMRTEDLAGIAVSSRAPVGSYSIRCRMPLLLSIFAN